MRTFAVTLIFSVLLPGFVPGQTPGEFAELFDGRIILQNAQTLSSDEFSGRAPGTAGGIKTTEFIAGQLKAAGVKPASGRSYFQNVDLVGIRPNPTTLLNVKNKLRETVKLEFGKDFVAYTNRQKNSIAVESEIVFVGYGIKAPKYNWNDYKGQRKLFRNKILLMLVNEPAPDHKEPALFEAKALTYYGRWTYKFEEAARQGAAGVILIHTDSSAGYSFEVVKNSAGDWRYEVGSSKKELNRKLKLNCWLSENAARTILKKARLDLPDLIKRASQRDFQPIKTGLKAEISFQNIITKLVSPNVVGMVEGSDEKLKNEFLIYTAHWDHLGQIAKKDGIDAIYNGAYDNASGVAGLLAIAEVLAKMPVGKRPKRSILFLFSTAEEQGLLGSEFYVKNPIVPLEKTLAVINLDGINIFGKTRDFIALGQERSDLDKIISDVARERELRVTKDPRPEQGFYFRSDQFPFAKAGIPALSIQQGNDFIKSLTGAALEFFRNYSKKYYHRPADEFAVWWDVGALVQSTEFALAAGIKIANADSFPEFNADDEFSPADRFRRLK